MQLKITSFILLTMKLHFSQIFWHIKKTYQWFPLEVIESNDNIILNKFNTYPSASLSAIHFLKRMRLFRETAFVFQLAMAWQSDEIDLLVVSSIRCTDALDLNFSQITLVESFLEIVYFRKKFFILVKKVSDFCSLMTFYG